MCCGAREPIHARAASPSARSQSERRSGTTSCREAKHSTTARPSMPPAPVTRTRPGRPEPAPEPRLSELDLTVVAHHQLVGLGADLVAQEADVPPQETALDAGADADDMRRLEHDAVLDLAFFQH